MYGVYNNDECKINIELCIDFLTFVSVHHLYIYIYYLFRIFNVDVNMKKVYVTCKLWSACLQLHKKFKTVSSDFFFFVSPTAHVFSKY